MSKIDKLAIIGVRSFDNRRAETIQFHTPLTLIVGYNGSGKTTIIECLKYATTGDLPPNSKGGAFIHDPKLSGEREVLAHVKLSFIATSGAKMTLTRNLQLTVKKLARTQKTLEASLLMIKNGERTAISSRVAELDQIMPQYLGVSKAILDNVIFCHQDESLWPMSEPSVLKKKFDEIFEALKYTKAIDNIKQLRKKQNEELGKYKIMEQHAKEDKDKADKLEKRSVKLQEEVEELRVEVNDLGKRAKHALELADKAWEQAGTYNQILIDLQVKRGEADTLQKSLRELKAHLKETPESDEWLESTLEQFESRLIQYKEQEEARREAWKELKEEVDAGRRLLGEKRQECGRHQADKDRYERQLASRITLIKETARQHHMRVYDDSMDDSQIEDFMNKLKKMLKDANSAVQRARNQADTELREANSLLNQLSQRKSALQENKNQARKQIAQNDREAGVYQDRLNEITFDEGTKATIESRIEDLEARLAKVKSTADNSSWDATLRSANSELRSLEDESTNLKAELVEGTKKASGLARLDHLKKELKDRQRSLETMTGAHGDRIEKLISQNWTPSNVEKLYQGILGERTTELTSAERDREGVSRELSQVEFKLKTVRNDLKRKQKDLQESVRKIHDVTNDEPSEFPEVLSEAQAKLDNVKADVGMFAGLENYYSNCLESANSRKACRLCVRPFRNEAELEKFKDRLRALVQKAKADAEDETVKPLEEKLETIRDAQTFYDTWKRLDTEEIPSLRKEEEELDNQRESILAQVEDYDKMVERRNESKLDVESLARTVSNIAKYDGEIKAYESQIHELSTQQSQGVIVRTLEDIQDQLAQVAEKTRSTKKTIAKFTNERDQSRTEISSLELELSNVRNELSTANFQLDKKAGLAARVQEFKVLNQKQREAIDKADQDIEKLTPEVSKAQAKYDDFKERSENKEKELQQEASKLSDSVHQLDLASEEIRSYIERGGPNALTRGQREIKNIEDGVRRSEEEQAAASRDITNIMSQLQDSENTKRRYADNLRYRREERRLTEARAEIQQLAASNAESDRDHFQEEGNRRRTEHNNLAGMQQGKLGEMKSKDNQLAELLADWNTDYKDARAKFKEAHIKVETTKAAVEDLGRYAGALDQAIMKYHGLKMAEINRIIEELWQTTYQGTDIDTILIKSEHENARGARQYNYRVCMVKQDVEMDMRGRCSAGQKVLASILIRLALAECFGVHCGIIALDEPTTNLDRDNIHALAGSLHEIIKTRQQQANFQLIVITHDEDFLRAMRCGDFADYYYRVSRDERQKSMIERQSIAAVM